MTLCPQCGCRLAGDEALCGYHHHDVDRGWAAANRAICDLVRRGKAPPRLAPHEREDEFWAHSDEAA